LIRDGGGFPWSLDFFASFFDQAKNEDLFYSEIEKQSLIPHNSNCKLLIVRVFLIMIRQVTVILESIKHGKCQLDYFGYNLRLCSYDF
jgi:hypothetical protein